MSIIRACISLSVLFRERPKVTLALVPVPWLSLVTAMPKAAATSAPSLIAVFSTISDLVMVLLLMTAFTSCSRLFTASAAPNAPLWAFWLAWEPVPPVNQFTAAAPDQAPMNTSSLAAFSSLPDVVSPKSRDTLSIRPVVSLLILFQLTLAAAAALKLEVEASLLGDWIASTLLKLKVLSTPMCDLSNSLSAAFNGAATIFFMAVVVWFWAAAPFLDHLSNVSKALWFSELEAPSSATELMVPSLLPVT